MDENEEVLAEQNSLIEQKDALDKSKQDLKTLQESFKFLVNKNDKLSSEVLFINDKITVVKEKHSSQ